MGAESAFLARQLEFIRPTVMAVRYAKLLGRQIVPVRYEGDGGTSSIVQQIEDVSGKAKVVSDRARDLPKVNLKQSEYAYPVKDLGIAFDYSRRELKAAQRKGMDISARKALISRAAMERGLDDVICFGDSAAGLPGFINNAQITPSNVPADGAGSLTTFASKTPDQILRDMFEICNALSNNSLDEFQATDLVLPLTQLNFVAATRASSQSDKTILQIFKQNYPRPVNVSSWYKLTGSGAGATNRMIAFERSPEVLAISIQEEFDMLPPQEHGLVVEVPCTLVTAGVLIDQPLGVAFRDGI